MSGEADQSVHGKAVFTRVLLKLSGEALMGPTDYGIHSPTVEAICNEIIAVKETGVQLAVVVGGGNIFRGMKAAERGLDRVTGDHIGMLATIMNSLALMDILEKKGVYTRVMSAVKIEAFCETYIKRRAVRHMEKGRLVIFAAGTGNPFFTTDTAAALRAVEIGANIMVKATNVTGVYSADPKKVPDAEFYSKLSFMDVLTRELRVMDSTAISLLKENNIPVRVVDIGLRGILKRVMLGEQLGTLIS